MKQTNNAIKFLMAQYRAIFKNANLKMILAAAAAAGALSAGAANAASGDVNLESGEWEQAFKDGNGTVTITGKDTDKGAAGKFQNITLAGSTGSGTSLELGKNQQLVVGDSLAADNKISAGSGKGSKLEITGEGTLKIAGTNKGGKSYGLTLDGASGSVLVEVDKVEVQSDLIVKTGADDSAHAVLLANSVVVGDGKFTAGSQPEGLASITLGDATGSGDATIGAREITINKDGKITLAAINGAQSADYGTDLDGELLNINGGILSFGSTAAAAGAVQPSAWVNVGKININNGGILSVTKGVTGALDPADGGEGIVNVNNGSYIVIGGTLKVDSGRMIVSDGATLAASDAEGTLLIGGPNHGESDHAVVELSSKKLASFLSGKEGNVAIKYKDESKIFDNDAANDLANATTGKVNLQNSGTIQLTDTANVDLATAFKFGTDAGSIQVAGDQNGITGTIKGQNLTVSKSLTNATDLKVEASNLTLGASDFNGNNSLGVHHFNAENVTLVNNSGSKTFTLKDGLFLESEGTGNINGSVTVDGGKIVIEGGAYTANSDVILKSINSPGFKGASLNVESAASALKVNGKFETTATNGTAIIEDGVLDLRNASALKVATGTIELQDVAELYVDGSKFITKAGDAVTFDTAKFAEKAVTGNAMSTMHITGLGSLTMKQYEDLVTKTGFSGSFTGFDVTGTNTSGSMTFSDSILSGTPDSVYGNTVMTVGADAIKKTYSFGAVKLAQGAAKLTIGDTADGVVKLTNANLSSKGFFVETNDGKAGDVHLATKDSGLKLVGTGKVGNITAAAIPNPPNTARESGLLLIGDAHKYGSANVTVTGNIGATEAILDGMMVAPGSSLTVDGTNIYLRHLYVTQGASLNAPNATITLARKNNVTTEDYAEFEVLGSLTAKNLNLAFKADTDSAHVVAGGATLKLSGKLSLVDGVELAIGSDDTNGLGAVVIADTLDLPSGAGIFVDPPYGKKASALIINDLKEGKIKGELGVGQNAITAIGFADEASAMAVVADYLDANGSFNPGSSVKNALVINKGIILDQNAKIILDPAAKASVDAGGVAVAKGAGLIITDAALTDPTTGAKDKVAITVQSGKKIDIDAGTPILLAGKFTAADKDLKLFSGGKLTNEVKGQSVNGMLTFTVRENGQVDEIKLDYEKLQSQMAKTSGPVRDLVGKILGDDSAKYVTSGLGYDYLHDVATTSVNGAEIDAVAHAATFAGAQVAAVAAVGTMAEAIGGRVGSMGVEAATIAATGSQANGGVWLTPAYKNVDADGFDAQGATYGADVDLTGVTFGADTVNGNMRFGAAFNIGSGDADGKGQGNGLKDEFDYYGVGIYSVMGFGSLAVVGDASFNVISHEVKGASGSKDFGDVSAKADTTAVTLGVTGQYTIATEFADITPHAGMRFTRLDTESYEMKTAKGSIGQTDFDVQNVFSIPVGVGVSKAFNMGDWTLAPNADLTLTFNTGDTDVNSSVRFDGVKVNTVLDTEVLDKVTYGLNLGLGAQNGNFGTSVSINYTGSSNTDSLGINANARFKF